MHFTFKECRKNEIKLINEKISAVAASKLRFNF